ncbi:hypothetical protein HCJ52_13870 [Listeria sp. FSL L7-1485]|uniref:Uncharacterized protein n=2 Tax=Listeria TaxID=1637 RepID=A0A7X0X9K5_9LIST|nr:MULTISPECIES: hypothetical protein [Listeria]MBC1481557.1 hypothetical protein [Listeria seeligeri]MBC1490134.1 hypothetical protein [Listeria immobilis]MBC1537203.1 hypothetical protein [Listeria immobilis]QPL19492.1 hypothetical protein pLIS600286c [Listeria ivanovii]UCK61623.1 hypothetical protein pLIS46_00266c [Listeria ivanovii]
MDINQKEHGFNATPEVLFHGSEANFEQFAYQQKHTTGISGLHFGIYLSNDRELALNFSQNKYLYEVNASVIEESALNPAEVTLSKEDVSHVVEEMVKNELQEDGISYFFTDYFGEIAELNETETWNDLYRDLTNQVAEEMLEGTSNDVEIANEIYHSFGGQFSDSASLLGNALKNIGVTHCVQTRSYENGKAIKEFVVFQPNELIIQNKIDIEKERQSDVFKNDYTQDNKQVVPIIIPTKNNQIQNTHARENQLEL